jgi:RES domain-containing protein
MITPFRKGILRVAGRSERGHWLRATVLDPATRSFEITDDDPTPGGRFNPPGRCPTLYLAQDDPPSREELVRWTREAHGAISRSIVLIVEVHLRKVLDLCDPRTRHLLGVTLTDLMDSADMSLSRSVGVAAFRHGFDGIVYPRPLAPWTRNLAVFRERADAGAINVMGPVP